MNNLEIKQEAIKNAYGEYWEQLTTETKQIALLNNGWLHYNLITDDTGTLLNCIEMERDIDYYRPKSLQGIENNNGWIKIESEKDLPKVSGLYFGKDYEFGTDMMYFDFETKKWEDSNGYLQNVTHYQPIKKPKPPIY